MRWLVFLAFVTIAGVVYSENCTDTNSCRDQHTTECRHHTHVFCHPTINQCVCSTNAVGSGQACTDKDSCPDCHGNGDKHCIDGHCVCQDLGDGNQQ